MKEILVEYDPFIMDSRFYVLDGEHIIEGKVSSDLNTLAENLTIQAYDNEAYAVKIRAPQGIYNELADNITKIENSMYQENKITVEMAE